MSCGSAVGGAEPQTRQVDNKKDEDRGERTPLVQDNNIMI